MSLYPLNPNQCQDAFIHNQKQSEIQRRYASGEVLTAIAYTLTDLKYASLLPKETLLLEPSGEWKSYQVHALSSEQPGIEAYAFVSTDISQKEVKIVFRGTHDIASLFRDFEISGPGANSMNSEKTALIEQLSEILTTHFGAKTEGLHLTVAGHSLGASDAENFTQHVLHEIAHHESLSAITSLSVYSFNSPGIPSEASHQSTEDLHLIQSHNADFEVEILYGKSERDGIQQLGESHLLQEVTPSQAHIEVLEMDKALLISTGYDYSDIGLINNLYHFFYDAWNAHALDTFFTPDETGKITHKHNGYVHLDNQNPDDLAGIYDELSDKAHGLLKVYKVSAEYLNSFLEWFYYTPECKECVDLALSKEVLRESTAVLTFHDIFEKSSFLLPASPPPLVAHTQDILCSFETEISFF